MKPGCGEGRAMVRVIVRRGGSDVYKGSVKSKKEGSSNEGVNDSGKEGEVIRVKMVDIVGMRLVT